MKYRWNSLTKMVGLVNANGIAPVTKMIEMFFNILRYFFTYVLQSRNLIYVHDWYCLYQLVCITNYLKFIFFFIIQVYKEKKNNKMRKKFGKNLLQEKGMIKQK